MLREYALLADGHRGALIAPRGDIAWLCAPRWDSDAVFASLIGGQGSYCVTPSGRFVWGGHYEEGSLIWRSRWVTEAGVVESREALAYPGERDHLVLLRRVIAVHGTAVVQVRLQPVTQFGPQGVSELARDEAGGWQARLGPMWMRFSGVSDASPEQPNHPTPALHTTLSLAEGTHHDLVLELSEHRPKGPAPSPDRTWDVTESSWAAAVPRFETSIATGDTRHSYAVLRGLTAPGGGTVAAATTSLPERARAGRNYDYRYVWIRDQCYTGRAMAIGEPRPLLDDAVRFVTDRLLADGPNLKPAYTVEGTPVPAERSLRLAGYPGGSDIVGNDAGSQFQLDLFGEALLLLAAAADHDRLDRDAQLAMDTAAAAIAARWREPDAGIWELDDRRWAHSRLMCAAGLRAAANHTSPGQAPDWSALADAITADTADCRHPTGRWQRAPDDPRVDAALLLPALRGAVPARDPRSIATLDAVRSELATDGYVYRFRHDARPLHEAEGAFTLCGFLLSQALFQQGDCVGAMRFFERNRAACGPPGLFSEEYDVVQRQLRGNLPQAFVHALLIETAQRLAEPVPSSREPT